MPKQTKIEVNAMKEKIAQARELYVFLTDWGMSEGDAKKIALAVVFNISPNWMNIDEPKLGKREIAAKILAVSEPKCSD